MFNDISSMQEPYQAVIMEGKWKALEEFFDNDEGFSISYPIMTLAKDNVFHIAVHSKSEEPLKKLLERVANYDHIRTNVLNTTNAYENTVLHEAAINHNIAAVKLLVRGSYVTPEQLLERNKSGQTPLFKAAAFGSTKVVKYLASQPGQMMTTGDNKQQLDDKHRTKNDNTSILHAAVRGEHFGTALELLKLDEGLAELKINNGTTSLHILTNLPYAFANKFGIHLWHRLLYCCIPTGDDNYDDADSTDEDENDAKVQYVVKVADSNISYQDDVDGDHEVGYNYYQSGSTFQQCLYTIISTALETIKKSFWKSFWEYFIRDDRWPTVRKIWKEKRKLKFAFMLAHELVKNDDSWQASNTEDTTQYYRSSIEIESDDHLQTSDIIEDNKESGRIDQMPRIEYKHHVETPLLAATRSGVIELVKEILKMHPQAVEHISLKKQNILHVAASYRQKEVFDFVKKMQIPTSRLILGIDDESYTVLHHVADTRNYNGGTRPGPAYQLQEELEWFKSVEEIMPSYFTQHHDKNNKTAKELFRQKHETQLQEAQKWIKETSQSCSGVAVLVATVVFAAAFTVPGGNNDENGLPILLHSPFFMFFTVMDVVSLSCSLTAVVMFLSIITSPFELDNFRLLLPRRLTLGFALLFMSVATTMLAFTSTIFLIIRSEQRRRWTLTLICSAAFVPVSVLALTHFPLFVSFIRAWNSIFKLIWMAFPYNLILQILKFLGNYIKQLGLGFLELGLYIKELGLGSLKFLHKLVVRFGLYIKELGISFLELGIYIKGLGTDFLKFLHKSVQQLGLHFLKFLHYLVR
ncbi:hypothetical protein Dsin_028091 [Dipteronia sinensis]|uniref:PGG domain-containing protein n=1 Tax=Dipteronia sinensis TaxID=43782 RepID=A0AAE0DU32_9ROSI|nr:hypothetical protein Dsin_028091 [Dipteronia sinensis]